jgi:hypothetical protein
VEEDIERASKHQDLEDEELLSELVDLRERIELIEKRLRNRGG